MAIAARYRACTELAGDIYDYVEAGDGAVALLIADVVGHGTSAAMMTGVVTAAFRASHVDDFEPIAVVARSPPAESAGVRLIVVLLASFRSGAADSSTSIRPASVV